MTVDSETAVDSDIPPLTQDEQHRLETVDSETAVDSNIVIHDTLSDKKKKLVKKNNNNNNNTISIYLCGVTVYDDAHIGHARTIIVFDVLRRYLEQNLKVKMIQNFTDVDDKIITRAQMENVAAQEISNRYIERYYTEFDALNVIRADAYPKATEHISDIIKFVEKLIKRNMAYVSKNGVYFAVSQYSKYCCLSKKRVNELRTGARIQVDEAKRDPLDFALWKFEDGNPSWKSPWGNGRPGWHIECSAMSTKYLGDTIDIHGGGRDLIFPHHENEIAQSESCTGNTFARIWMHVGMVTIQGEKMSKSLGNIRSVRQALNDWGPNVIRLFCLSAHYAKPIDYSEENIQESLTRWRHIEACYFELIHATRIDKDYKPTDENIPTHHKPNDLVRMKQKFKDALNDDLNTHLALSALLTIVSETNNKIVTNTLDHKWAKDAISYMTDMLNVLGLNICKIYDNEYVRIDDIVTQRNKLRESKQYEKADTIRDELLAENVEILDRKGDTVWIKREKIKKDTH